GIHDSEMPPNDFDSARAGQTWNYLLVDPVPTVSLTSPTNGAYILAPATIPLRASAGDNDGTITIVEFYESGNKVGEASSGPPYSFTWPNVLAATYTLRAVATDNSGLRSTSAPVVINVVTSLPIV